MNKPLAVPFACSWGSEQCNASVDQSNCTLRSATKYKICENTQQIAYIFSPLQFFSSVARQRAFVLQETDQHRNSVQFESIFRFCTGQVHFDSRNCLKFKGAYLGACINFPV